MSNNSVIAGSVVIAVLLWAQGGSTQNRPSAPAIPAAPTNAAAPAVAEQADQLLKEMSAYIGSANEFTFHADITFDHVLPSRQKLQFSAAEEVVLKRPGGLYVEWNGDLGARQFWYDGKSVTLYDPATPFYANEAATPEIDNMLEQTGAEIGLCSAARHFLYRNLHKERPRQYPVRPRSRSERRERPDVPHFGLCREGYRFADLD